MKISGFSFCRNAHSLFYPFQESVQSVLPLVDEFVIAVGKGEPADDTRQQLTAIGSDKIRIIDTEWDTSTFRGGTEYARQTNIAKAACTGDWLLYLQADEVIHEEDLPMIEQQCRRYANDSRVEGMIFDYLHFWGNYHRYHNSHGWYPREIRMIKNRPDIYSWVDAQSFRRIPNFDGTNFAQREGTHKLNVIHSKARIFHYGWVRPPDFMQRKKVVMETQYHGSSNARTNDLFQYGDLSKLPLFTDSHPAVMSERIAAMDWQGLLDSMQHEPVTRAPFKHEKPIYKSLTWIEQHVLFGNQIGAFKNYHLLRGIT